MLSEQVDHLAYKQRITKELGNTNRYVNKLCSHTANPFSTLEHPCDRFSEFLTFPITSCPSYLAIFN